MGSDTIGDRLLISRGQGGPVHLLPFMLGYKDWTGIFNWYIGLFVSAWLYQNIHICCLQCHWNIFDEYDEYDGDDDDDVDDNDDDDDEDDDGNGYDDDDDDWWWLMMMTTTMMTIESAYGKS